MRAIRKMFTFACQAGLVAVAIHLALRGLHPGAHHGYPASDIAHGALALATIVLGMVFAQYRHILLSYGNVFTRILAGEALLLGPALCATAFVAACYAGLELVWALSVVQMGMWVVFGTAYQLNKSRYEKQGCGPVPVDTCVVIPPEIVKPGDAIGTGGLMARLLRQGVAHTETVIMWEGKPMLFSSWFENGAFLNDVGRILKPDPKYPNYLLQRRPPMRADQVELMEYVVRAMIRQNAEYVVKLKARRARMPAFLRKYLDKKFPVTGYDWLGRYTGRRAPDRWTCNVVYLEVMRRSGVEVVRLGQGAAGLRTGWFDIPNTEDLRGDEALHLVRNAEVPGLLAEVNSASGSGSALVRSLVGGRKRNGYMTPDDQTAFDCEVERLVTASTNIFAGRQKRG